MEWVSRFLERHFVREIVINRISLNDAVLRNVIKANQDVFELEHAPAREGMRTVDRLKYTGRGVTESEIYEEYGEEPLEKIKVRMNNVTEGVTVAFYKHGKVTIYRESDPERLHAVLKLIIDKIVAPHLAQTSFQKRLFE